MNQPPVWSSQDLDLYRQQSIDLFRRFRLEEPLENYTLAFDEYRSAVENLIELSVDLSQLRQQAEHILSEPENEEIVRCLTGPPISKDDLKTLIGMRSITRSRIRAEPAFAREVIDLIMNGLDQRRFPWVRDGRDPTEAEKLAAVIASAALLANRRVGTARRHLGKSQQEQAVADMLTAIQWKSVKRRRVTNLEDAPQPGEFCGESNVCGNNADLVVRLMDRRLLLVECKVSNSAVNSIKRLNDAKKKATEWKKDLGEAIALPAAVLSGVFDLKTLQQTQSRGLTLFWGHDLDQMAKWIQDARLDPPAGRSPKTQPRKR
jgi:hypothetical protein